MQDKNLHSTKKFTDRAWGEMKTLLDKELPVEDNGKKRPLFWWLVGSTAIAAAFIGLYFINNPSFNIHENQEEKTGGLIVEKAAKIEKDVNSSLNANPENKLKINSGLALNQNIVIKNDNHIKEAQNQKTNQANKFDNNVYLNNLSSLENSKNQVFFEAEKTVASIDSSSFIANKEPAIIIKKPIANVLDKNITLNKSDIVKIGYLPLNKIGYKQTIEPLIIPKNKKIKKAHYTLYASTSFRPGTSAGGLGAGIIRRFNLAKKDWWLEAGLGYSFLKQPLSYIVNEGTDPSTLESTTILDDFGYSNSTAASISGVGAPSPGGFTNDSPSNNLFLHYLTMPISLNRNFGKFFFSGGLQTNFLLSGSNEIFKGGLFDKINLSADASEDSNSRFQIKDKLQSGPYSIIDITGTVGAGYTFNQKWSAKLQYDHGFIDVLKTNSNKDFNRFFQISVRYSW